MATAPDADRRPSMVRAARAWWLAALAVALLTFALANAAAPWTGFNPDESRWLSRAHYLGDLGDPFGPTWDDRYMTRGQPPLGSYAMGLALLVQGRDLETNPPWDFSVTWEENIALGSKPSPDDLAAGRRASAVLVALTALALMVAARAFVAQSWAIVAGALFAIHPFTSYIGSIAMADALFGLTIALAAVAAAAFARRPTVSRAALIGVSLGLGGATKLSPLLVAAGLSALALAALGVRRLRHGRISLAGDAHAIWGTTIVLAAVLTFVAVYPYLWPDPVGRTGQLFAFRAEEMATQAADWPVMAVPSRAEALRRVHANFTERFNLAAALGHCLGGTPLPPLLRQTEFLIALAGVAVMAATAIRQGPFSAAALVLAVLGGQALVTLLGMRSEFDRYHLPMALLGAIAAAAGLEAAAHRMRAAWSGSIVNRREWSGLAPANGRRQVEDARAGGEARAMTGRN